MTRKAYHTDLEAFVKELTTRGKKDAATGGGAALGSAAATSAALFGPAGWIVGGVIGALSSGRLAKQERTKRVDRTIAIWRSIQRQAANKEISARDRNELVEDLLERFFDKNDPLN